MIAVLEGVNRVGKTTAGRLLSQSLAVPYMKDTSMAPLVTQSEPRMAQVYAEGGIHGILAVLEATKSDIVIDRFHLTEYVYGSVDRGYDAEILFREADARLTALGATLVLMTDDVAAVSVRAQRDVENLAQKMQRAFVLSSMRKITATLPQIEANLQEYVRWLRV